MPPESQQALPAEIRDPILVYQMGKVGSRTVFESLRSLPQRVPALYHFHLLNGLDALERTLLASPTTAPAALTHVRAAKAVRERFLNQDPPRWNVITLVRDPVARNLSSFFYQISEYIPDFETRSWTSQVTTSELLDTFLQHFDHAQPLSWFDDQFRDLFHFDVFADTFPAEAGYQIHRGERIDLLLLRAENLDRHFTAAINDFLGVENLGLKSVNTGAEKSYGPVYGQFLAEVVLPADYLRWLYGSKLARHFYSPAEIEQFRDRWSRGRGPSSPGSA